MLNYQSLRNKPRIFQSLTGISLSEFEDLLPLFEQAWQAYVIEHHIKGKLRQRRYGGGRPGQLKADRDKLLFILVYFRLYPTQEVQGYLFGMGQPQANEWIHKLSSVLNQALGYEKQLSTEHYRSPSTRRRSYDAAAGMAKFTF